MNQIIKCAIALLLIVGAGGCGFLKKIEAKDKLNKAAAAYNSGNYDRAVDLLEEAEALDPTLQHLKAYLGASYYAKYNLGGEEENIQKALEVYQDIYQEEKNKPSPDETTMKNTVAYIAVIYKNLGQEDKYRAFMEERLALPGMKPKDKAEIYYALGTAYWNDSFEITQRYMVRQATGQPKYEVPEDEVPIVLETANKGMEYIEKALELDAEYGDALSYKNLLLRELAKVEKDPDHRRELVDEADRVRDRALELINRKKKQEQQQQEAAAQKQES